MHGCMRRLFIICLLSICAASRTAAAEVTEPWSDDALLNDVQLIGAKYAFAVGEHGVIWKSDDGGRKWSRVDCGLDASLCSVCFLTDQDGWIAGRDVNPHASQNGGVLLSTHDGGRTWKQIGRETLPPLNYVKFFDLDEGVVVGQPTPVSPSGILKTNDGGLTWRGVPGETPQSWKAMSFLELERGAVAGISGRVALMGGDQLFESKLAARGLRSVRAIRLLSEEEGWLAGDGGLVLRTANGGIAWEAPASQLPEELREGMDFRAVDAKGEKVWLTGSPGSVIWHSPDKGQHWLPQTTGQTAPISALRFSDEVNGIAVGAFGVIIRTGDGGKTWQTVRGDGRRAAVLSIHARSDQTNAPLIAKLAGESGYRSAVWIAQREDIGPLAISSESELRLQSAVQKCGGHASDIHWQLPVFVPGLESSPGKLTAEWQKQTEGRLAQAILGTVVRQIRTWRPNLVLVDQPAAEDAACQLLYDAVQQAVEQAADPTRFAEQMELLGLAAWRVDRVFIRLAPGAKGDATIDLDEYLPGLKLSPRIQAGPSIALLQSGRIPRGEVVESSRIGYRLLENETAANGNSSARSARGAASGPLSGDFFKSLSIAPGSAARRDALPFDEASFEHRQKMVERQRNFISVTRKSLDDPRVSGQMLGQLRSVTEGMEPQQAAGLLSDLADEYRKRSQFDMVESTYRELIHQYPNQPVSLNAMQWLIQFWCSSEVAWQRTKKVKSESSISVTNPVSQANYVQQGDGQTLLSADGINAAAGPRQRTDIVTNVNAGSPTRLTAKLELDANRSSGKNKKKPEKLTISRDVSSRAGAINEWQTRAIELAKQLEATAPGLYRSAEIQFPLAAMRRTRGSVRAADAIMRNFVSSSIEAGTRQLAERDLWASFETQESPDALAFCRRVTERPLLDGMLSDLCWQDAIEIRLTEKPVVSPDRAATGAPTASMLMLAYDDQFLFVAFSAPRAPTGSRDKPQLAGRKHDADLSQHDHVSIRLDIDRDYYTWYEFQIDQRGWTAESCWEDRRWDPQYYVAAEADSTDWRVEVAIPWSDLTPDPPQNGSFFGLSIRRTIPAVGFQSWTHPITIRHQPASFGLLKFQ